MRRPVLVVDDDSDTRKYLSVLLSPMGYQVHCSESGEQALAHLSGPQAPAVMLLDLLMPRMSGLEVLDELKRRQLAIPVIVLSTVAQIKTVVEAVQRGACHYLTKPFEEHELELALQNALEKQELREEVDFLRRRLDQADGDFVSSNPRLLRIKDVARQVADTDVPVLLLGESGVGKEVVARFIHGHSRRRGQPFVKVNCAALPQDLLESELFGYERGAFSGAHRDKPGKFELAHRGSILLDEIGEMSFQLQAKLLHVLQDGVYTRLGGRHPIKGEARVLASTNARLEEAVAAGRFRADLYFRLNVVRIEIPPLRDRREDIPLLCAHFLRSYAARYDTPARLLPRELREAFMTHDWPGNIRELENAIRRYTILPDVEMALMDMRRNQTGVIATATALPDPPRVGAEEARSPLEDACRLEDGLSLRKVAARAADEAEQQMVGRALAETKWNRKAAAALLKISYKALLNKLKRWEAEGQTPGRGNNLIYRNPATLRPRPAEAAPAAVKADSVFLDMRGRKSGVPGDPSNGKRIEEKEGCAG
jgi:two-component system response regulator AtoC